MLAFLKSENFAFLILRILELFACEVYKFLQKSRLIFNIFYCFLMFVKELFTYLTQKVKGVLALNFEHIIFI